ncbi:DUF2283 domain-containing protein [Candidatus Parcubacteria bacterium]|nr:MAG: DUF2283 domain-containing protein [Candidatus Parcubacteria bacterium]
MNMQYFYDKEADVFYFSQGKPSPADETVEAGDDVLLRVSKRTKKVRGFTLLNASRHNKKSWAPVPFTLTPTASVKVRA